MYEELVKRLREPCLIKNCVLCQQAAEAIEELNSQLDDSKRMCLPLKENRLYKYSGGSLAEVFLVSLPEPPKEET